MLEMDHRNQIYDQWLVERCKGEDSAAFDELLERWQERLWRHALRLTGQAEAAWDILQETCLIISRKIHQLDDAASFSGWAYRIASNQCRDWFRRERHRRQGVQGYIEWLQHAEQQGADCDRHADVREALTQLETPDQTIISLRYDEGFSVDEIAGILAVPSGTVKSRLYHARKRLRTVMEESDHE